MVYGLPWCNPSVPLSLLVIKPEALFLPCELEQNDHTFGLQPTHQVTSWHRGITIQLNLVIPLTHNEEFHVACSLTLPDCLLVHTCLMCLHKEMVCDSILWQIYIPQQLIDRSVYINNLSQMQDHGSQLSYFKTFPFVLWLWMCPHVHCCVMMFVVVSMATWRHYTATGGCRPSVQTWSLSSPTLFFFFFFTNSLKDDQNCGCDGALTDCCGSRATLERMWGGSCALSL